MTILASVRSDLAKLPVNLQSTGLAAIALALAERLDSAAHRDSPAISKELRATMEKLEALASSQKPVEVDPLDAIKLRRVK